MADARKNTLLYHFMAANVVRIIQELFKPGEGEINQQGSNGYSAEEIHKVI